MATLRVLIVAALFAAAACKDPTGNDGPPAPTDATLNTMISGEVAARDSVSYRVTLTDSMAISASLTSVSGIMRLTISDAASGAVHASVSGVGGAGGYTAITYPQWSRSGTRVIVTVTETAGASARFRLLIYRNSDGPETRTNSFVIGDTVTETIDPAEGAGPNALVDYDAFYFQNAVDSQELTISFQRSDRTSRNCNVSLWAPGAAAPLITLSWSGYDGLQFGTQTTNPIRLGATGRYDLFIGCVQDAGDPRAYYQLLVRPVNRAPEGRSAAVALGDTIDETIAHTGDFDTYHLTAVPGTEVKVFFQSRGITGRLKMVISGPGVPVQAIYIGAADSFPISRSAPGLVLPQAGPYVLEVQASRDGDLPGYGPYRVIVYPVNRRPETATETLTLGDTAAVETLPNGDIDEYRFTLATARLVNVELLRVGTATQPFELALVSDPSVVAIPGYAGQAPLHRRGLGTRYLAAGTYQLRVRGDYVPENPYTGSYRIHLVPIDDAPESRSASFAVGDTVTGSLTPGDIDRYTFSATAGAQFDVHFFIGTDATHTGNLGLRVRGVGGSGVSSVAGPASGTDAAGVRAYRHEIPATGDYAVSVEPVAGGRDLDERGDYRFVVVPYSSAPEWVAAMLTPGDSIVGERMDEPGDLDEYFVQGAPNQEVTVVLPDTMLTLQAIVDDTLRGTRWSGRGPIGVSRFRLGPNGTAKLRVFGNCGTGPWPGEPQCTYPVTTYRMWVYGIDRAPEGRPAAIQIGDTVSERIAPIGDIDEYTFDAVAGDSVTATLTIVGGGAVYLRQGPYELTSSCVACVEHTESVVMYIGATGTRLMRIEAVGGFSALGYRFVLSRP